MKAVIYARISPTKREDTDKELARSIKNAIELCTKKAKSNEDEVINIYKDQYVSGKEQKKMISFQEMIKDANAGKFKRIYVRRIDRFGRNLDEMIRVESELHTKGISIYSVEENLDTSSPIGRLVMHILSHVAEWKRKEIIENTARGRREAEKRGVAFGRKLKDVDMAEVIALINNTPKPMKEIAMKQDVSVGTIYKRLKDSNKAILRSGNKRWVKEV